MESTLSSDGKHYYHYDGRNPRPPWEQHNTTQVPYMAPNSSALTHAERQALLSMWATRDNGTPDRHRNDVTIHGSNHSNYNRSFAPQHPVHDTKVAAPRTAGSLTASRSALAPAVPKDSYKFRNAPKSTPQLPAFVARDPPSPPESHNLSRSSTKSSDSKSEHYHAAHPQISALPGTMSAREKKSSRGQTRSKHRDQESSSKNTKTEPESLGKRFKVALKDIFKRDPIDETEFERIEGKHWADE